MAHFTVFFKSGGFIRLDHWNGDLGSLPGEPEEITKIVLVSEGQTLTILERSRRAIIKEIARLNKAGQGDSARAQELRRQAAALLNESCPDIKILLPPGKETKP